MASAPKEGLLSEIRALVIISQSVFFVEWKTNTKVRSLLIYAAALRSGSRGGKKRYSSTQTCDGVKDL